jgi:hypothetical protein
MWGFLRIFQQPGRTRRAAYNDLLRQETEYQLRINELNRKIEKQQQRQRELLEKGKFETNDLARLGLAEQYARGERQERRLREFRTMLVKAQEIVEVQRTHIDLQDLIPEEVLSLNHPDAQRERVRAELVRDRLDQAYGDMLANAETGAADSQSDAHEQVAIAAALQLFDRERDEEIRVALRAIEEELPLPGRVQEASLFGQRALQAD